MNKQQMLDLLSQAEGVNLDTFDAEARKPLSRLWDEIECGDVTLTLDEQGRAIRSARTVRTTLLTPESCLLEVGKRYENGPPEKRLVNKIQEYSLSETMHPGERDPEITAVRCLEEEFSVWIQPVELWTPEWANFHIGSGSDFHKSSVYPGVWSNVFVQRVFWVLPRKPEVKRMFTKDTGTTAFLEWFDGSAEMTDLLRLLRSFKNVPARIERLLGERRPASSGRRFLFMLCA